MRKMMREAIEEAKKALAKGEVPIGAVIEFNGEIIGRGHNQKEALHDPTAHAEIMAIRQASAFMKSWHLDGCALYVTAEPCPMCMGAMIQAHIDKLVFGVFEPRYGSIESTAELGKHPMCSKNFQIYSGICEAECAALLSDFFDHRR